MEIFGQVEIWQVYVIGNFGVGIGVVCVGFEEVIVEVGVVVQ